MKKKLLSILAVLAVLPTFAYDFMIEIQNYGLTIPLFFDYIDKEAKTCRTAADEGVVNFNIYENGEMGYPSGSSLHRLHATIWEQRYIANDIVNRRIPVVIPETVTDPQGDTYTVVEIGAWGFEGCRLVEVVLPNTITKIGEGAFAWCTHLEKCNFPEQLEEIDDYAFLMNMENKDYLIFPETLKRIGKGAFMCSSNVAGAKFNEGLIFIDDYAFAQCSGWGEHHGYNNGILDADITISNTVTYIGKYAFYFTDAGDQKIVLGEKVQYIGDFAFYWTHLITDEFYIPCGVQYIGSKAFYTIDNYCRKFVYPRSNPNHIAEDAFQPQYYYGGGDSKYPVILYVPKGSKPKFMACSGWHNFYMLEDETLPNVTIKDVIDMIDGYVLVEKDEECDLNSLLGNLTQKVVARAADGNETEIYWDVLDNEDGTVNVTEDGNLTANELGTTLAVARDANGNLAGCVAVYVCPTVKLIYPDGESYKHLALYNSLPELTVEAVSGYGITKIEQYAEGDAENSDAVEDESGVTTLTYAFSEPVTENKVIQLYVSDDSDNQIGTGVNDVKAESAVKVSLNGREIVVAGAQPGAVVTITNLNGQTVYSGTAHIIEMIDGGVYILTVEKATYKLIIK